MNKYKAIIVEDEKWIRLGLKSTINWGELGIDEVLEAADGAHAWDIILARQPDIIISDIKMPNMTGLQLTEKLRELGSGAKIILITAFGEFAYAQSAIKNGVSDYILKPIQEEKVTQALKKCIAELDEEARLSASERIASGHISIVQKHYFNELMHEKIPEKTREILSALQKVGIDCAHKRAAVVSLRFVPTEGAGETLRDALETSEFFSDTLFALNNHVYELCLISVFADDDDTAYPALLRRLDDFAVCSPVPFRCGFGAVLGIEKLSLSYESSKGDFARRFFALGTADTADAPAAQKEFPHIGENSVINLLVAQNKNALETLLSDKLEEVRIYAAHSEPEPARQQLLSSVDNIISRCLSSELVNVSPQLEGQLRLLRHQLSLDEMKSAVTAAVELYFAETCSDSRSAGLLVNSALKYIHEHYNEELYMNQVAKQLYVNPSYFSHVFSEQLNVTFTKYLNNYRIKMAKELMGDSTLKVYDVASMVGIEDYRYFVKLFKKSEGVTPTEYRNRVLAGSINPENK